MSKITSVDVETEERKVPVDLQKIEVLTLPTRDRGLVPMLGTSGNMQIPLPNRSLIIINVDGTAHMQDPEAKPILDFDSIKTGTLHASQTLKVGDPAITGWRVEMSGVDSTYPIRYWDGTTTKFSLDKSGNVVITGSVIAGEIHIPGENPTPPASFHVATDGNTWWGCTATSWAGGHDAATAYVLSTGEARFKKVTLDTDVIISGIKPGTEIAIQGWSSTLIFTTDGYRKVDWSAGGDETIMLLDGTEYTVATGTTGDMTDWTFIYLQPSESITELQFSSTYSDAVGTGKILIAIANLNSDTTSEATLQVFGGMGGNKILVDNIVANSASIVEIITNTAQIASAMIGDAQIDGTLSVGSTDAKCTDANADETSANTAADSLKIQTYTLIDGGYISTGMINADRINVGSLPVAYSDAKCTDPNADQTSANAQNVAWLTDAGALAYENTIGLALLDNTVIVGGYIKTSLLTADNIITGALDAATVTVGGWTLATNKITSYGGNIELQSGDASTEPHIKAIHDANNYIQMTAESNVPRLDIIYGGHMRTSLREQNINFYNASDVLGCSMSGDTVSAQSGLVLKGNFVALEANTGQSIPLYIGTDSYLGSIVMDQTTGILGIIGDTSVQEVEIYGDLVPQTAVWDLGKPTRQWKDLYITGAAYIDAFAEDVLPYVNGSLDLGASATAWQDVHIKGGLNMYSSSTTTQRVLHVTSANTANLYCDKHFIPVGGGASCTLTVGSDGEYWENMYSDNYTTKSPKFLSNIGLEIIKGIKVNSKTGKIDSRKNKLPKELLGPEESGLELGSGLMVCFDAIKQIEDRLKKLET